MERHGLPYYLKGMSRVGSRPDPAVMRVLAPRNLTHLVRHKDVPTTTFRGLMREFCVGSIGILKLDIEGYDIITTSMSYCRRLTCSRSGRPCSRGAAYSMSGRRTTTRRPRFARRTHKALRAAWYTQARLQTAHDTQDVYLARLTEGVRLWEDAGLYKVIDPLWACRICKPISPEKKGFFDSLFLRLPLRLGARRPGVGDGVA